MSNHWINNTAIARSMGLNPPEGRENHTYVDSQRRDLGTVTVSSKGVTVQIFGQKGSTKVGSLSQGKRLVESKIG